MKTLFLILFAASVAVAQVPEPFKDANTIIFKTGLPDSAAFNKICRALVDRGYALKMFNKTYHQVRTDTKVTKNVVRYFLIVNVLDGEIIVRPMMEDDKLGLYNWSYRKSGIWTEREVFDEIMGYFWHLGNVVYAKR